MKLIDKIKVKLGKATVISVADMQIILSRYHADKAQWDYIGNKDEQLYKMQNTIINLCNNRDDLDTDMIVGFDMGLYDYIEYLFHNHPDIAELQIMKWSYFMQLVDGKRRG